MSHDGERGLFARRLQVLPRDVPFALAISEMLNPSRHRWRIGLTVPDMLSSPPVPFGRKPEYLSDQAPSRTAMSLCLASKTYCRKIRR